MGKAPTIILMAELTSASGRTTSGMDAEKKYGRMGRSIMESSKKERSMGKGSSSGWTGVATKESSTAGRLKDKALIGGPMGGSMRGVGKTTKWKAKAC